MIQIDGNTQLIGLLGWPLAHTLSPAMHNAAAAALGLNWVYLPLPVHPDDVQTAVFGLPALGFRGVNVTVPYKQAVMSFLDEVDPGAKAIGAVNTIVVSWQSIINNQPLTINNRDSAGDARLVGYNTDWSGFLADLQAYGVQVAGRDCLVLGAGGSARAVVYALATIGGRVRVLARRQEQAVELVQGLRPYFIDGILQTGTLTDLAVVVQSLSSPLVVNTTPIGMTPQVDTSPWPDNLHFPAGSFVYDLVYNPRQTSLIQQARAAGCQAENGLGMLVQQGAAAFQMWTGMMPDIAVMHAVGRADA